jgi:hypothetical protein
LRERFAPEEFWEFRRRSGFPQQHSPPHSFPSGDDARPAKRGVQNIPGTRLDNHRAQRSSL